MATSVTTPSSTADRLQRAGRRQPLAPIWFGVALYSTGPVFVQASSLSGPVFSFWRLWLGVPVLGVATLLLLRKGGRLPDLRALRWPLYSGLAFGLHQLMFMTALKATSVTDVSLMNTLAPIIVAIVAVPLFGERPSRTFRLWTLLAMAGAAVVVLGAAGGPEGQPLGMVLALGNVFAFAAFFLVSKLSRADIDVLPFLLGTMFVAALTVSAFVWITHQPLGAISGRDLLYTLAVAAGPGAVGHFATTWPLRWVAANVPPVIRLAQPVLSGLLAFLILGEAVTTAHLLGGSLTLAGVCGALLSPVAHGSDDTETDAEAEQAAATAADSA